VVIFLCLLLVAAVLFELFALCYWLLPNRPEPDGMPGESDLKLAKVQHDPVFEENPDFGGSQKGFGAFFLHFLF